MNDNSRITRVPIQRITTSNWQTVEDAVAIEDPLEIRLNHQGQTTSVAVTMRTPGNDHELALGFLFTEGIIKSFRQIENYDAEDSTITIRMKKDERPLLKKAERNFYTTSSCGVCGKASIDAIKTISAFNIHNHKIQVEAETLHKLEKELVKQQAVFSQTGGLHASALFDGHGNFLMLREDVGRHNALDKLIGVALMQNLLPLSNSILLLSGRTSFELIQKASMAGIPIVAAVGAPSSLAVELARETGITLIGFLRSERFNIYCGEERIHSAMMQTKV